MLIHIPTEVMPAGAITALRRLALNAAVALRDCSLRLESSVTERQACRVLMRGQALHWRDPLRPGS